MDEFDFFTLKNPGFFSSFWLSSPLLIENYVSSTLHVDDYLKYPGIIAVFPFIFFT